MINQRTIGKRRAFLCGAALVMGMEYSAEARSFRAGPDFIPNARALGGSGCVVCHLSPGGGGPRNAFGNRVRELVTPGGRQQFWDQLFDEDSDGDGFTNGEELGDPNGAYQDAGFEPDPNLISAGNPGLANSVPTIETASNTAPRVVGEPATEATLGLDYASSVVAEDDEQEVLSFELVEGPDWLSIDEEDGSLSGVPPLDSFGGAEVTVRVSDGQGDGGVVELTYSIAYISSYAGWSAGRFPDDLPEADKERYADADSDGIWNINEYIADTDPMVPDEKQLGVNVPTVDVDDTDRLVVRFLSRVDDPTLVVTIDFSDDVLFETVDTVVEDQIHLLEVAGLASISSQDVQLIGERSARFARIDFSVD